jgi:hypothetical protein
MYRAACSYAQWNVTTWQRKLMLLGEPGTACPSPTEMLLPAGGGHMALHPPTPRPYSLLPDMSEMLGNPGR